MGPRPLNRLPSTKTVKVQPPRHARFRQAGRLGLTMRPSSCNPRPVRRGGHWLYHPSGPAIRPEVVIMVWLRSGPATIDILET